MGRRAPRVAAERISLDEEWDSADRRIRGLALTPAGASLRARLFARLYSAPPAVASLAVRDQRALGDVLKRFLSNFDPGRS